MTIKPFAISTILHFSLVAMAVVSVGCVRVHDCRPGTLLITLNLNGAENADELHLVFTVDQNPPQSHNVLRTRGSNLETIELTFPSGYSPGQHVSIEVDALLMRQVVAKVGRGLALNATCTTLLLSLDPVDMAVGQVDMATGQRPSDMPTPRRPPVPVAISAAGGVVRGSTGRTLSVSVGMPVAGTSVSSTSSTAHSVEFGLLHGTESK
jgi:hypothetical protein